MRNLKRLLFIGRILLIAIVILGLILAIILLNPIYFLILIVAVFIITLWYVSDDFIE